MNNQKYLPNLDGLRAYAAFGVLLFHLDSPLFQYGWIGVPAFFILSGYLITDILLNSKNSENFFQVFYARRSLRIFPIYFIALLSVTAYALLAQKSTIDLPYYIFYLQNYKLAWSYWQPDFPALMNHTWSLAIEEQFYLIFPFLVFFLNLRRLFKLVLFAIGISILSRYFLSILLPGNPIVWANSISNLDTLCAGAALAILSKKYSFYNIYRSLFLVSITTFFLYFIFTKFLSIPTFLNSELDDTNIGGQLFSILLLPLLTCLVTWLIYDSSFITKTFFANKIILYFGKMSYGLYLYHFIIYKLVDWYVIPYLPESLVKIGLTAILKISMTVIVACLSWYLVESRILKFKKYFKYKKHDSITLSCS